MPRNQRFTECPACFQPTFRVSADGTPRDCYNCAKSYASLSTAERIELDDRLADERRQAA
jgi:hypothetical protein